MTPVMNVVLINDALEGVESKIAVVRQHIQTSGFQTGAPEQGEVLVKLMHELVGEVIFAEEKIVPTEFDTAAVEAEAQHEDAPVVDVPPVVSDETHVAENSSAVAVESNTKKGDESQL